MFEYPVGNYLTDLYTGHLMLRRANNEAPIPPEKLYLGRMLGPLKDEYERTSINVGECNKSPAGVQT
ncbi:hypothetical protein J1614_002297 [Plenodomus biglobosus]|nr:hypothetical protein J1614_002297 [Plenodomus biglobosus]